MAHRLGVSRAWILAHPEATLTPSQSRQLEENLAQLEAGTPLPYVLGEWEFFGRMFRVSPDVLIPRPETELLVERAIEWLANHPRQRLAADVGTGSGCIAISLARQVRDLRILALDISLPALRIAQDNARRHQALEQVWLVQSDLLAASQRPLDLICANLPYIPSETLHQLRVHGKEPGLALDGGPDGLQPIRRLLQTAGGQLGEGGAMLLEIEASQGQAVLDLCRQTFPGDRIELHADLSGHDRLIEVARAARI